MCCGPSRAEAARCVRSSALLPFDPTCQGDSYQKGRCQCHGRILENELFRRLDELCEIARLRGRRLRRTGPRCGGIASQWTIQCAVDHGATPPVRPFEWACPLCEKASDNW